MARSALRWYTYYCGVCGREQEQIGRNRAVQAAMFHAGMEYAWDFGSNIEDLDHLRISPGYRTGIGIVQTGGPR